MNLKAILFDLHGTLGYVEDPISSEEISEYLLKRNYEVYPQSLDAASYYVGMIDYPKYGYNSWQSYLERVLHHLDIKMDVDTLRELTELYQKRRSYLLFSDAPSSVTKAKDLDLKTAIVTTIAHFCFSSAIEPIRRHFDVVTTGFEVGCEKSNPKMHRLTLRKLGVSPTEAVMIGDNVLVDIKIPKKLGMHTILLDRTNKILAKPKEANMKVSTLTEALAYVEKSRKR